MTSCLISRSISSMRATSKVASLPLAQIVLAASFGMTPSSAMRVGGMRLDLEPDVETGLRLPDGGHFGAGIAGDHRGLRTSKAGDHVRFPADCFYAAL